MRARALALLTVLVVAGCGGQALPGTPAPAGAPLPTAWPTDGSAPVRPTPLPPARLLGYLPEVSQGHVLCNAVGEANWPGLLRGETRVEVYLRERCHAVSALVDVAVELVKDRVPADRDIAGFRAAVRADGSEALVELASPDEARRHPELVPALSVKAKPRGSRGPLASGSGVEGVAAAVAEAVLRGLPASGPGLPELTREGDLVRVTPREVPPGTGVADQPLPVAAEQLCTALGAVTGANPATGRATPSGSCSLGGLSARLGVDPDQQYPDQFGGRPGYRDGGTVVVRLTDTTHQIVMLAVPDPVLARLVPIITGR